MPDRTGQQLGNYRLIKLLGTGGFADVYLGEHVLLKSHAAIKVLHTQIQQNVMTSFLQEAQTIERLRNPYIVRFLDFGKHPSDDLFFLIMEYAPQGNLRDLHPRGSKVSLSAIYRWQFYPTRVSTHPRANTSTQRKRRNCPTRSRTGADERACQRVCTTICHCARVRGGAGESEQATDSEATYAASCGTESARWYNIAHL